MTLHVKIQYFEELEEKFDEIMEKYAPINIIEGGPPCVECKSNMLSASFKLLSLLPNHITRSYMVRFAELIQKIRSHPSQGDEPVYFLCENVVMKLEDSQAFEPIFGLSPVEICAQQLSPAKRLRGYFTNVPVNELPALA